MLLCSALRFEALAVNNEETYPYQNLLLSEDADPSKKFWMLDKRIKEDKKNTGVQLEMSRSNLIHNIISLINEGAISFENLEEFSDELKETVSAFIER